MNTKDKQYTIEGVLIAILWVAVFWLVTLLFEGCMTPQKAVSYLKKKELLADTCAANYPVKERVDTLVEIQYKEDSTLIKELLAINKQLQDKLAYLDGLPPKIDSATCQQLRLMYTRDVKAFLLKIDQLKVAAANQRDSFRTIIKTKIDVAQLTALQEQYNALQKEKQINDAKNAAKIKELTDKVKRKNKWLWGLGGGCVLLLLIIGFLIAQMMKGAKIPFLTK